MELFYKKDQEKKKEKSTRGERLYFLQITVPVICQSLELVSTGLYHQNTNSFVAPFGYASTCNQINPKAWNTVWLGFPVLITPLKLIEAGNTGALYCSTVTGMVPVLGIAIIYLQNCSTFGVCSQFKSLLTLLWLSCLGGTKTGILYWQHPWLLWYQ